MRFKTIKYDKTVQWKELNKNNELHLKRKEKCINNVKHNYKNIQKHENKMKSIFLSLLESQFDNKCSWTE